MAQKKLSGPDWKQSLDLNMDELFADKERVDILAFTGAAAAGPCTLTGVKVGDVVMTVTGVTSGTKGDQSGKFQTTITVNDQIQQTDAGNLSANVYLALIQRKS